MIPKYMLFPLEELQSAGRHYRLGLWLLRAGWKQKMKVPLAVPSEVYLVGTRYSVEISETRVVFSEVLGLPTGKKILVFDSRRGCWHLSILNHSNGVRAKVVVDALNYIDLWTYEIYQGVNGERLP